MDTPVQRPSPRRFLPLALGLLAIILIAPLAWYLWSSVLRPVRFNGLDLQGSKPLPEVTLTGTDGQPVRLGDLQGKLVVLYFGYTFCPDACPMTLAKLAQARAQMGEPAKDVQVVMVTVDPERDTPEVLQHYVTRFDPSFIGLTGRPEEIAAAASTFGVYYKKNEGSVATGYLVDHTAVAMVVDRGGRLRLILPHELDGGQIASDLKALLTR
ncbi:MAG: SCO family protein [Chloroflexi bacterium]|nr:SCO family protein [Chloroflexota bacterium]